MVQKHRFKGGNARLLRECAKMRCEAKVGQNTFSFLFFLGKVTMKIT